MAFLISPYKIYVYSLLLFLTLLLPTLAFSANFSTQNSLDSDCGKHVAYCEGERHYPDGMVYLGEFMYGKPHGQGVMTWKDGSIYKGQFFKGLRQGEGEQTFSDGSSYLGEFNNGFMQVVIGLQNFPMVMEPTPSTTELIT